MSRAKNRSQLPIRPQTTSQKLVNWCPLRPTIAVGTIFVWRVSWFDGGMTNFIDLTEQDRRYLKQCVVLAREALDDGDEPFGTVLVSAEDEVLFSDRNRVSNGDHTRHPEFAIARWAAEHLTLEQRASATVYTSGEHCPMCSAAHAWVGLGRIVYASSCEQLAAWHNQWGIPAGPVAPLPIPAVAPHVDVAGPDAELAEHIRQLQAQLHGIELDQH